MPDETMTLPMLAYDFVRRVGIELKGRTFNYSEEYPANPERLGAILSLYILEVLPETAREFASKIKPEWLRCYKIPIDPTLAWTFTALDPVRGLSIRGLKAYDPMRDRFLYRFDAAFG